MKVRAFVPQAIAATLRPGGRVAIRVDGVAAPVGGAISYIAPQVEYTPPVIFSRESREKLVILIEARLDDPQSANLHPGQPVDVEFAP